MQKYVLRHSRARTVAFLVASAFEPRSVLTVRTDLKSPLLSSNTDAEREAELTQLNGKLYTVEKAPLTKSCPLVANAPPSSVVR